MALADSGHGAEVGIPGHAGESVMTLVSAPPITIERWFNTLQPLGLEQLRGKVVVMEAFQMLCPGCVAHGIPQAQRIHDTFSQEDVIVLGLHTVFEHHSAMTPVSLAAFLHEYKVSFPVGVDASHESGMPKTMRAYAMQGTPTLVLIDAKGRLRKQWFGAPSDLIVGAEIMRLVVERQADDNAIT
ncbi:MAG: redoxin domain-containing protein [Halioglobus sp.]|nr:redoxin domain-containing protein [Halioglobus sp.]